VKDMEILDISRKNLIAVQFGDMKLVVGSEDFANPDFKIPKDWHDSVWVFGVYDRKRPSREIYINTCTSSFSRTKRVLTSWDIAEGIIAPMGPIRVITVNNPQGRNQIAVLPLLCAEILQPHLWWTQDVTVDVITHCVGFNMFDEHQFKAWRALQQSASLHFQAPLVCSSGGEHNELNLTGLVTGDRVITTPEP